MTRATRWQRAVAADRLFQSAHSLPSRHSLQLLEGGKRRDAQCESAMCLVCPVRIARPYSQYIRDRSRGKSRVEIASVSGVDTPLPTSKSLDPSMRRSAAVRQLEFLVSSSAVIYLLCTRVRTAHSFYVRRSSLR